MCPRGNNDVRPPLYHAPAWDHARIRPIYDRTHHLQSHASPIVSAGTCRTVSGQCSSGDLAFSRVGQPQPSVAGSRNILRCIGCPQYDTVPTITRRGQRSQTLARWAQSGWTDPAPARRATAVAYLAAARDRAANREQQARGMSDLSDEGPSWLAGRHRAPSRGRVASPPVEGSSRPGNDARPHLASLGGKPPSRELRGLTPIRMSIAYGLFAPAKYRVHPAVRAAIVVRA